MYLFKMFLSNILFELLDVENGSPVSHKYVKVNYLDLELTIDPLPTGGISHTMIS